MTTPNQGFPSEFVLRSMDVNVQDLARLVPELPAMELTAAFVTRTIESALLRIPLPAALLSHERTAHRYVVRYGGETLVALREFTRDGSEACLVGGEFALPGEIVGATFEDLSGRWRTRILETRLSLYEVGHVAPDALVVSLGRRMNGWLGAEA
ncbi:hypothetical protein JK364_24315 [Streptomyces sp. 110]|uniref:Uncharacterized protein n=1 Tax=Streptomyces endocoffeicus TaxID=2898945 RepID=A0ABS1PT81_9ACTN|nr:hypothetical protein [Streptomyces endocoffeicus]MBL1115499.1 hypothetical protein [Streptomyces endocoffeicus]